MFNDLKYFAIVFFLLVAMERSYCQTGFYLTYKCKEGNEEIKKIDRQKKNYCIVTNPILSLADISSVSELIIDGNRSFFDLHLTEKGFRILKQVFHSSEFVVFMVQDEVTFIMDTKVHELFITIRIQKFSDVAGFITLHRILLDEMSQK